MKKFFSLLAIAAIFAACSDDDGTPTPAPVPDKYQGGFYVLNEGQGNASINYYNSQSWDLMIYRANNGDEKLGVTGTVAVCNDNNMYIVTKEKPFMVEVGLSDFKKKSELGAEAISSQARSFALLDSSRGVLTTTTGAYVVSLDPLTLGAPIVESRNLRGDVAVGGGYIFLLTNANEDNVIKVYNASTFEFVKDLGTATTGFAEASGALWAANGDKLVKIDLSTLTSKEIALKDDLSVYYNQWAFTPTGLHASKAGDALYFVNGVVDGFSTYGRDIYKYTITSDTSSKVFSAPVEGDGTFSVYGCGVNVDSRTGDLYLVYTQDGWGEFYLNTDIYVVDASTGQQKQKIAYTSDVETVYWFPSMLIFR